MFNNVKLLVDSRLCREIDKASSSAHKIFPWFSQCMQIMKNVTDTVYGPFDDAGETGCLARFDKRSMKYFDGWHAEFNELRNAVESARRMEFVVKIVNAKESVFELRFYAFGRGQKPAYYELPFFVSFIGDVTVGESSSEWSA